MKKISLDEFLRLRRLVYRNARPLDYMKWKFLFENGSCDDFLQVLAGYQNEDGGFGHNIECNNWNPGSAPYTVCIALDYLDTAGDYESEIKSGIIGGIVKYLDSGAYLLDEGWVGMQGIPGNISILTAAADIFCGFPGKQLLSPVPAYRGEESGRNH